MPYMVWVNLESADPDERAKSADDSVPELIGNLLEDGWEVLVRRVASDEDDDVENAVSPPELLDVQILGYPRGAYVGLIVDTGDLHVATAVGVGLGKHLTDAAPVLMGWTTRSLRVEEVPDGRRFVPPERDAAVFRPRFPLAQYLPSDLQELCAQFLIAGAIRGINNPTEGRPETIDAADVVAATVTESPWRGKIPGALGALLVAAARYEAAYGASRPLTGRGEGDAAVAEALLATVRADRESPTTEYDDDDHMRGYVLLHHFAEELELDWTRVDPDLERDASDARNDERLRTVLWASLRALATMTQDFPPTVRTPWLWLSHLDPEDVDPIADALAERDEERVEQSDEDTSEAVYYAARAHLLIRVSLLHPDLIESDAVRELVSSMGSHAGGADPLIHLLFHVMHALSAENLRAVAHSPEDSDQGRAAARLAAAVQTFDDGKPDAMDGIFQVLEELWAQPAEASNQAPRVLLVVVCRAAASAGSGAARDIADELFSMPSELACVIVGDRGIDGSIRRHVLAEACLIDPLVAADVATSFPELASDDPRAEPALRNEFQSWWASAATAAKHETLAPAITDAVALSPGHGKPLLQSVAAGHGADDLFPGSTPTYDLVTAVAEALSALALAADTPDLPFDILT
ncbi:hypothetical protein Franean1_2806 [Parafrankia sp. EAN1pec]|uniref:hypothetical protein n=1 Tax=Parafrankia sp. (strain EAN1pec) TaxID=298653 RepID=UPI0000542CEB|nr:hypothetical protein Franean1_2806 [Frankia sp. EAN1pec]